MSHQPKQTVKRLFRRNGVAAVEETFLGSKLHGRRRTWHRNGRLATEAFYHDGLLHGVSRQWNDTGKLLGSFHMEHGTGTQRTWHDNGRLNLELSTVDGRFYGRSRLWLRDGKLISDEVYLAGKPVSATEYRQAASQNPRLPKLRGRLTKPPVETRALENHIHRVFVAALLNKRNQREARAWLKPRTKAVRSLGRFKTASNALKFVEELYQTGAVAVIAVDIYRGKAASQYADALLVQLPTGRKARESVRQTCAQLSARRLGSVLPPADMGERHLYLSLA
jgi:hypothetical protein